MPSVLLLINEEAHARELARVARLLGNDATLRPVYFVDERMKPFGVHHMLAESGVETLTAADFPSSRRLAPLPTDDLARRAASALLTTARRVGDRLPAALNRPIRPLQMIASARDQLRLRLSLCEDVLTSRDFATLVLCEDNIDLDTAPWILVAQRRGIRSVIVPYTIANSVELTEAYVFSEPLQLKTSLLNRLAARQFPKWATQHKGRKFLRTSYARIAAIELLGLAPPNPWLLNSGAADTIAAESCAMRDYYREAGIPAAQITVTGTLVDDVIAAARADAASRRRALLTENGLPLDRPVLLCAFPPDQGVFDRPGCEFSDYDDMIAFWGECLGAVKNWNVIVSRHPKTRPGRLDGLRKYGVTLTDSDTAPLVPLCDLYVASVSATIRWAFACGIPVINYDAYRLDFVDYVGLEGVVWMNARNEFRKILTAATADAAYFARLRTVQQREAPRWGFHDGQSGRRLRALIGREPFEQPACPDPAEGQAR